VYFEIQRAQSGGYFWRIRGGNNEIMANSEVLSTQQACYAAISVVKRGAAAAQIYDRAGG
jgi:uncharacterized protein